MKRLLKKIALTVVVSSLVHFAAQAGQVHPWRANSKIPWTINVLDSQKKLLNEIEQAMDQFQSIGPHKSNLSQQERLGIMNLEQAQEKTSRTWLVWLKPADAETVQKSLIAKGLKSTLVPYWTTDAEYDKWLTVSAMMRAMIKTHTNELRKFGEEPGRADLLRQVESLEKAWGHFFKRHKELARIAPSLRLANTYTEYLVNLRRRAQARLNTETVEKEDVRDDSKLSPASRLLANRYRPVIDAIGELNPHFDMFFALSEEPDLATGASIAQGEIDPIDLVVDILSFRVRVITKKAMENLSSNPMYLDVYKYLASRALVAPHVQSGLRATPALTTPLLRFNSLLLRTNMSEPLAELALNASSYELVGNLKEQYGLEVLVAYFLSQDYLNETTQDGTPLLIRNPAIGWTKGTYGRIDFKHTEARINAFMRKVGVKEGTIKDDERRPFSDFLCNFILQSGRSQGPDTKH